MSARLDLVLAGGSVVQPRLGVHIADIGILDGRIATLAAPGTLEAATVHDVSGLHVFPGVIDPHAHLGLGGGMAEYETDTAAATLGGVTTIFTILIHGGSYIEEVTQHRQAADPVVRTDYGLHLTLMGGNHIDELPTLVGEAGITSFKYYMSFRGDEGAYLGVEGTTDRQFYQILEAVRRHNGVLAIHPENIEVVWHLREQLIQMERDDLAAWNDSRPPFTEAEAIVRASYLANDIGCPIYLVHLSSRMALDAAQTARRMFPDLTVHTETCPHFLTHTMDSPLGSVGKVNPPLRSDDDTEALWDGLADMTIDVVGSDHVGRRRESKAGTVWNASAGFPGTSTILPVLLNNGYHEGRLSLTRIAELTSASPARIFGVHDRKGQILPGFDADLAVVDLDWERTPTSGLLGTWSDYSLYENQPMKGWPRKTFLRGQLVQEDGAVTGSPGIGRYLPRNVPM